MADKSRMHVDRVCVDDAQVSIILSNITSSGTIPGCKAREIWQKGICLGDVGAVVDVRNCGIATIVNSSLMLQVCMGVRVKVGTSRVHLGEDSRVIVADEEGCQVTAAACGISAGIGVVPQEGAEVRMIICTTSKCVEAGLLYTKADRGEAES